MPRSSGFVPQVNADWNATSGVAQILNKPTINSARIFSTPTFASATTATQLSATRDADVSYEFDVAFAITVLGTQTATATLTQADNSAMTTNPVVIDSQTATTGGVVGLTSTQTLKLQATVPAGKYRKVTFATSATGLVAAPAAPSALRAGQEVIQ